MKKYTIYFHHMITETEDINADEQPNGNMMLDEYDYSDILNKNLTIKFLKSYGDMDKPKELHFECWLDFIARDDKTAKANIEKVLEKNGFGWVSIYYLLERDITERVIASEGIDEEKE